MLAPMSHQIRTLIERLRGMRDVKVRMDLTPLVDRLEQEALDDGTGCFGNIISEETQRILNETADKVSDALLRNATREVSRRRRFRAGFESRLLLRWDPALRVFDLVQGLATEFGMDANARFRPQAAADDDFVFEALTRLHGRACLTASEIGALLRTGHATGANTRWRTLNEIATVSWFIAERGNEVAKRYLEHQAIEMCRGAEQYQQFAERLGADPLSDAELEDLRRGRDELKAKYGKDYINDYGWAAQELGIARVTFRAIAEAVSMAHWLPYMRMASHGVHSGPRGAFFDLGLPEQLQAIPASVSHFGLAEPGANGLISLGQATIALLNHCLRFVIDVSGIATIAWPVSSTG